MERIDKLLSATGRWSRKEVKELVRQGRVLAGGRAVLRPEEKGDPATLCLTVDGVPVDCSPFVYVMLNKPEGVLSATEDNHQPTVLDLLPPELRRRGLFPVGRLDKDTTGLLSPRKHVDKVYLAQVDGVVGGGDIEALAAGLTLADGTQCLPAGLEPLGDGSSCLVTLREGKYHQVKRMLAARGKPVRALHRLSMGSLTLDRGLKPGKWRFLTLQERTELQRLDAVT